MVSLQRCAEVAAPPGAITSASAHSLPAPSFDEYLRQLSAWPEFIHTEQLAHAPRRTTGSSRPSAASTTEQLTPTHHQGDNECGAVLEKLRTQVPALFFDPDFDISKSETLKAACPIHERDETTVARRLAVKLDAVRP